MVRLVFARPRYYWRTLVSIFRGMGISRKTATSHDNWKTLVSIFRGVGISRKTARSQDYWKTLVSIFRGVGIYCNTARPQDCWRTIVSILRGWTTPRRCLQYFPRVFTISATVCKLQLDVHSAGYYIDP